MSTWSIHRVVLDLLTPNGANQMLPPNDAIVSALQTLLSCKDLPLPLHFHPCKIHLLYSIYCALQNQDLLPLLTSFYITFLNLLKVMQEDWYSLAHNTGVGGHRCQGLQAT